MALDRYIQDFVQTNKLLNKHIPWSSIVLRSHVEDGRPTHVYSFTSGGCLHNAVAQRIALPDAEWYRIRLTHPSVPCLEPIVSETDLRFDILQILQQSTHTNINITAGPGFVAVQLTTRHMGRANIMFIIESAPKDTIHQFLV